MHEIGNNLIKVIRTVGDYKFITSDTKFIKEQFIRKIGGKLAKQKELSNNEKKDTTVLFGNQYLDLIKKYLVPTPLTP